MIIRLILALLLPCLVAFGVYYTRVAVTLGAQPLWADKALILGLIAGACLGLLLAMTKTALVLRMAGPLVLAAGAYFASHVGRTRFVASYADDVMAGQLWYFGAIIAFAFLFAALTAVGATRTSY